MFFMGEIYFFNEDEQNTFQLPNESKTKLWIKKVVDSFQTSIREINYIFCSDEYLLSINQEYLQHDTLTDIITFDYREEKNGSLEGEIYISIERVEDNAKDLGVSFEDELDRVIIHGILHLLGYKDETEEEERQMRNLEDKCLLMRKAI
ncbi:MAG: rRNA maturation RNase YbeY [Flammeovirgaceae bacterium]